MPRENSNANAGFQPINRALPWILILFSMLATFSFAGQDRWTSNGPEGGYIQDLAVDPSEPATLYAATYGGGVFKSTDAGETWKAVNAGITDYAVSSLAIDPADPSTIYAGTSSGALMKSVDAGESWAITFTWSSIYAVAIDPKNHKNLYVATSDGVFFSADRGENWSNVSRGLPVSPDQHIYVWNLAIDGSDPKRLYAGMGVGLYTSENGGGEWKTLNAWLRVTAIAVDPSNSQKILVGVDQAIALTTDGGKTWKTSPIYTYTRKLLIDPLSSQTVYAATDNGLFRTLDAGATWRPLGALPDSRIATLAFSAGQSSTALYAGTAGSGVFRSTDGATNWSSKNAGLTAGYTNAVAIDPVDVSVIYGGTAAGIFKTVDGGNNWVSSTSEVKNAQTVVIDPVTSSILYAGGYGGASKTADGGETWTQVRPNPTAFEVASSGVHKFVIDRSNPSTLYAALVDGGLSKSADGGRSWSFINSGLELGYYGFSAYSIVADPTTPSTLFAGSEGVSKSTDSGASWKSVREGLFVPSGYGGYFFTPQALAIDPGTPSILYAASWDGIFRTVDGAAHWTRAQNGIPPQSVTDVAIDPADPSTVYATTYQAGIFRSSDRGQSWTKFNTGLPGVFVNSIAVDATGTFLVAGTSSGVFTYEVASKVPRELQTALLPGDVSRVPRLLDQLQQARAGSAGFVVVASGTVTGGGGTRFRSDVSLVNHADTDQSVVVIWLAAGSDGTYAPAFRLSLPPSVTTSVAGLPDKLGLSGLGCLVIIAIDSNENIDLRASIDGSSRIWTTGPHNSGTVSELIPGLPLAKDRTTSSVAGLRSDPDFRTNVAIVNLDTRPRTFSVDVIGELYSATVSVDVPALSMRQIPVPRGDYGALQAVFRTTSGDFLWAAYGSSVDNATGEGWVVGGN